LNSKYKHVLFLIFFIFSSSLFSQVDQEKRPLSEILGLLQEKYDYQFTYADDVIKDITITPPTANFSINEVINYLRKETNLIFQFLDNKFISINARARVFYICGYIIDKETTQPLESVAILGKTEQAITDSFGYFKLRIKQANESIAIRHLGFQSISKSAIEFEENSCLNIFLKPQIEVLSEITLSNFIAKGIDKVADGTFNINFSNFGILPGLIETDVLQTVQALPGIQSVSETVSDINIRGGTHDQNLILWDDIKMYQSGHFFGLISIFNPQMTKNATIIKNGTGVDFTDGTSGTISMKTADKINNTLSGSIGANFINIDGFIDVPLSSRSSFQLSTRKAINNLVGTPTYDSYFERIAQDTEAEGLLDSDRQFDFYDFSFRWLYEISHKDFIRISGLYVNNELLINETGMVNQVEESRESSLDQRTFAGGIFYRRDWSDNFVTLMNIYETDYTLGAENVDIAEQQRLKQENVVSETSIKLNTWYKYNEQLSFLNGYQYTETGITNSTKINEIGLELLVTDVLREHGLYSQVNYTSQSNKTFVKAGVRYNYIEDFNEHILEPRLNVNHKFLDYFNIEISGEFKHQNTSQVINFQNDFLGIEKRRWQLSDNDERPVIISKQASLGISYANKGWLISTEGYYKDVQGISSQSQGFLNQYQTEITTGSYAVKGLDFLINKKFDKISTWLSYTYADNEYTFEEFDEVNFLNNIDITHSLGFGTSFTRNDFKVSAGVNWHTGRPTTLPELNNEVNGNTINYNPANSSRIREYLRVDFSATYKFNLTDKIRAQAGISALNAINQENIISNYFRIDNNAAQEISNKALQFTPNVSFRVLF
jgi:hypothetical protein